MCAASIYHLRKALIVNLDAFVKHERSLLFYTIAIAVAHVIKSAQQIFWFVTMVLNNDPLFSLATSMYNLANALTTFAPPLLLLFTSRLFRKEV
ncbi:hypothetical protein PENTCL1PPCAC_27689, partial [Pristionchus entomophagus]